METVAAIKLLRSSFCYKRLFVISAIIINLYGSPGAGKSTTAFGVMYKLKLKRVNCEFVSEYAKQLVWHKRQNTLACQPYVFGKMLHAFELLSNQVDVIVTDSPLLLSSYYGRRYRSDVYPESSFTAMEEVALRFNRINFFLERVKPYVAIGRNETEEESNEVAGELKKHLDSVQEHYLPIPGDEAAVDVIVDIIMKVLDERRSNNS